MGGRPPITRVHAAPAVMDDGSDMDMPATASQDHNPQAVTHTCRQSQAPNKSTSAHQHVQTSHCAVPDDEEEVIDEDILSDQEGKDEDDIYGIDSAALGKEVG